MKNHLLRYEFVNKTVINYMVDLIGEKVLITLNSVLFIFTQNVYTERILSIALLKWFKEREASVHSSIEAFRQ